MQQHGKWRQLCSIMHSMNSNALLTPCAPPLQAAPHMAVDHSVPSFICTFLGHVALQAASLTLFLHFRANISPPVLLSCTANTNSHSNQPVQRRFFVLSTKEVAKCCCFLFTLSNLPQHTFPPSLPNLFFTFAAIILGCEATGCQTSRRRCVLCSTLRSRMACCSES